MYCCPVAAVDVDHEWCWIRRLAVGPQLARVVVTARMTWTGSGAGHPAYGRFVKDYRAGFGETRSMWSLFRCRP